MPPPFPPLPPEAPFTDAEFNFRDDEPRRLFPENQDSNWGLLRRIFTDQLDDIYKKLQLIYYEMFPQSSTEFLDEWERMVGLPRNPANRTTSQRRALILARLQQGPFTHTRRWNIVDEFIRATFGQAIRLYPPGVELVPEGVPIYNDTPPGEYFQIKEIVTTFYYEIQVLDTLSGINTLGLNNALTWIQYAGLHYRIRYLPDFTSPPVDPGL
jgi:hypothetical protein